MSPFLNDDMPALRDQMLDGIATLLERHDLQTALGLVVLAVFDPAVGLGDDRRILRAPRFEQLRHPWQTAGDVTVLEASLGRRTSTSPAWTSLPPSMLRMAPTGRK